MLARRPLTAGAIAGGFSVSRPAVSRHLRVLREAGMLRGTVRGREREYGLVASALEPLERFLSELRAPPIDWERRLAALETEVHRVRRARRRAGVAAPSQSKKETA